MAVQAQHVSRAFYHDLNSYSHRAMENRATGASLLLDEGGGCAQAMAGNGNAMLSNVPRSDLTCNYNSAFVPRKRARVLAAAASGFMDERTREVRTPVGDMANRAAGSGVASTSGVIGDVAGLSQGLLSHLCIQGGMEIDALVRVETERMRAAWRRHVRALVAAAERAAEGRLRAAEAALELARRRNAELEERLRQIGAEGQAWMGIAQSHEAAAAGLLATLDQLLQSPCAAAAGASDDAEDARSCCFETPAEYGNDGAGADDAASTASAAVRAGRACCCCRAATSLCAPRATPPWTPAPCARPPRTPRSMFCCADASLQGVEAVCQPWPSLRNGSVSANGRGHS